MKHLIKKVEEFYKKFNIPYSKAPTEIPWYVRELRYELMREENEEYAESKENDIESIADALGDKLYILIGTIIEHGLQDKIEDIFNEIHKSNMSKLGKDGKPIYREDGKILKGEDYFKPNIRKIVGELQLTDCTCYLEKDSCDSSCVYDEKKYHKVR